MINCLCGTPIIDASNNNTSYTNCNCSPYEYFRRMEYLKSLPENKRPQYVGSCKACEPNLTLNNPKLQYQNQKLIQKTVRVSASEYMMNYKALTAYEQPTKITYNVCWNQMSDRPVPSVQKLVTASGSTYGGSSYRRTLVRNRPGAMSPGGKGCDIKHNSYERRLNRLKAQKDLKAGPIPLAYGAPVPFNLAFPVYGGKTVKTNLINGCICLPTYNII